MNTESNVEPIDTSSQQTGYVAPADRQQAPKPEPAAVEPRQETTPPATGEADGEQAPEKDAETPAPLPKGVVRKINKLTRKAGDAERTAREKELEVQLLQERLSKYEQSAVKAPQQDTKGRPTLEQFDYDQEAHADALVDWKLEQRELQAKQAAAMQKQQQAQASVQEKFEAFEAEHPGFLDSLRSPTLHVTDVMRDAIYETETPAEIAALLASDPERSASIARLSPVQQIREIARIEVEMIAPAANQRPEQPPKRLPNAPPPVTTLNSTSPISKSLEDMDFKEYEAERNRQDQARR